MQKQCEISAFEPFQYCQYMYIIDFIVLYIEQTISVKLFHIHFYLFSHFNVLFFLVVTII